MDSQKLDNALLLALAILDQPQEMSEEMSAGYDEQRRKWELIVKYNGSLDALRIEGVEVEELLAGYAIVTLSEEQVESFASLSGVEYVEKPKRLFPQLRNGLRRSCFLTGLSELDSEWMAEGTGEGILLAIIDSGLEYWQEVFQFEDGTTRVEALYDQTKDGGTIYEEEQINDNLRKRKETDWSPLSVDPSGHGTLVGTIAATGAPKSKLLIVKLDTGNQKSFPTTTSLMRAISFVIKTAGQKKTPVAINISYGNTYGSHDGTSLVERFLNEAAMIGRNVICVGCGNEGASAGHYAGQILDRKEVELTVGNYEKNLSVQIWKNFADRFTLTLVSPDGQRYVVTENKNVNGQSRVISLSNTKVLIYQGGPKPYQTLEEWYFEWEAMDGQQIMSGIWRFEFEPIAIVNGRIRMYLPSEVVRSEETRFLRPSVEETLTIPSTAQQVISVGAYDTYYDAYADFSGRGQNLLPTQQAATIQKPDITAPGVLLQIPYNEDRRVVSGTSYATPFVTAAAARLMSYGITKGKDPYLYGEKVKAYLCRGARQLPGYSIWPNAYVGWGALCVRNSAQ